MTERITFTITFRSEPHVAFTAHSMRALLKMALRRFGLRCIDVRFAQCNMEKGHPIDPLDVSSNMLTTTQPVGLRPGDPHNP